MADSEQALWQKASRDKWIYKFMLMLSMLFWVTTIAVLAYIGNNFYLEYLEVVNKYSVGVGSKTDIYDARNNMLIVAFSITIIVAVLSSIVMFMRQRSAALHDIQLRLAMLEQLVTKKV